MRLWTFLSINFHFIMLIFHIRLKFKIICHHACRLDFCHQNIIGCSPWIFYFIFLIVQMSHFFKRITLYIASKVCKKCWRYSPCNFSTFLCFFKSLDCVLCNDNFMESCMNISSCHVLKSDSRLKKQATIWYFYS